MEAVFREAQRLLKEKEPFVLATVVRTHGSTPQKPGAKLLVRSDGKIAGTLGGGCVEAEVWQEAQEVLRRGGGTTVREFALSDELAAESGMVCGGSMDILIDPDVQQPLMASMTDETLQTLRGGPGVAIVTLAKGASPGAKLLIREDGSRVGSLGAPYLDAEAAGSAQSMMAHGGAKLVTTERGEEFFVEAFASPPTLLVGGAGHIAKALYTLAKYLGFRIIIVDDRPDFANRERFPEADEVLAEGFVSALQKLHITPNTFIVVATRGHKYDDTALREAAKTSARYVGLVGSRRKTILIYESLLAEGIPLKRLCEIHAPIGLNIGARTPEEIAISIVAEIIMEWYGGDGRPMKLEEKLLLKAAQKARATTTAAI